MVFSYGSEANITNDRKNIITKKFLLKRNNQFKSFGTKIQFKEPSTQTCPAPHLFNIQKMNEFKKKQNSDYPKSHNNCEQTLEANSK